MMRVSSTASPKRSGSSPKPGASRRITAGVKASASASSTTWLASSRVKMRSPNSFAASDAALLADARIGRHERRRERALGEDRAEMIGQPERDEERIRDRPGAEHRRHHDVAQEAGDARQERQAADGQDAVDHPSLPVGEGRPANEPARTRCSQRAAGWGLARCTPDRPPPVGFADHPAP